MKIEAFVDFENIGISFGIPTSIRKISFLATALPSSLGKEGLELARVTGFFCWNRPPERISHKIRKVIREEAALHGWEIISSNGIADKTIMSVIGRRLDDGSLPEAVMLISNDRHFSNLMRRVSSTGRTVVVAGTTMSKQLREAADRALDLWGFLGDNPEVVDWDRVDELRRDARPLNPLASALPAGLA